MKHLKDFLNGLRLRREATREERLRWRLQGELQVAEWKGSLYLTFRGKPLLPASRIEGDPLLALRQSRETLADFYRSSGAE